MIKASPILLDTPVMSLDRCGFRGLGNTTARKLGLALASLAGKTDAGEATVEDLLNYLPMRYEDRSNLARISNLYDGLEASLELYVRVAGGFQVGKNRGPKMPKLFIFEITASDPERTGKPVVIWWFVSGRQAQRIIAYHKQKLTRGARFIAYGKWEWDSRRNTFSLRLNKPDELEMLPGIWTPPEIGLLRLAEAEGEKVNGGMGEKEEGGETGEVSANDALIDEEDAIEDVEAGDPGLLAIHVGRRVPVYRKLGEFRSKRLREIMHAALAGMSDEAITETLPAGLRARQHLIDRAEALRRIHFPSEDDSIQLYETARSPAHLRLIFEEFFWVALALGLRRGERIKEPKGAVIEITERVKTALAAILPFTLTSAQERVITRIFDDMQSDAPMNRLLQGDVGSGKTIVALLAMLAAMENGYQTALMAPTEILAEQHARNIKRLLAETPYRVELLTGSCAPAEKRRLQTDIAAGEVHAVHRHARADSGRGCISEARAGGD